jgi:putative ABC transport system ATP-binding protein
MIEAKGASLTYMDHGREIHACENVDLSVSDGEFLGILGPSGSGKSSLLYLMSGLKNPTKGEVIYEGRSLHGRSDEDRARLRLREFGFVFQYPYLIGYLSSLENVLVGAPGRNLDQAAKDLLEELGLGGQEHRLPYELSGGQRQRVCLARALLGGKKAVFADEPTAALDHATGMQVMQLLSKQKGKAAIVMVTHDPSMLAAADRIVEISDGRIVQENLLAHS